MSISPTFPGSSLQKSSLSDHSTISEPFTVVDRVNGISAVALDDAITRARSALLAQQREDGHWCFSLEADCTIPAEYILMMHFMDEIDTALERRIANFLRNRQVTDGHGGWPLYYGGDFDMSCSVKVYYA